MKTTPIIEKSQCIKCGEVVSHTYLWKHIKDKHIEMMPILQDKQD